mmetsp:Transcript_23266/g.37043  ORF Transcript_23266/g.37043 Transcript_23266/m.37043 type:complete len:113 (-) Transcript_23266:2758-3096(-)
MLACWVTEHLSCLVVCLNCFNTELARVVERLRHTLPQGPQVEVIHTTVMWTGSVWSLWGNTMKEFASGPVAVGTSFQRLGLYRIVAMTQVLERCSSNSDRTSSQAQYLTSSS